MKLRFAAGIIALLALLMAWAIWQNAPVLRLGAAWYAKTLCSGVFVGGREPQRVIAEDVLLGMSSSLRRFRSKIERSRSLVSASFYGFFQAEALYRPGLGCTLLTDTDIPALQAQMPAQPQERPILPSTQPWPYGTSVTPVTASGSDALTAFVDAQFIEPDPDKPRRTRAIVVVHEGGIIAERYADGLDARSPLPGWSMAKSAVNALVGILVGEGLLSLGDSNLRSEWSGNDDRRRNITVAHLMQMTSGLAFGDPDAGRLNDVRRMLYLSKSTAGYAAAKPPSADAGSLWSYSSGSTSILSALVKKAASRRDAPEMYFPQSALFDRLGMSSAIFERDGEGVLVGSAFLHASARDWARLGLFYLQDGVWRGERILPEGWVTFARSPAKGSKGAYGAHFWLRASNSIRPNESNRGDLPGDAFFMLGRGGQMVAIVPSKEIVVVRLGLTRDRTAWDPEAFVKDVIARLPNDGPRSH